MDIAIVKYNAGNIFSVVNALRRLGVEPTLTDDPQRLRRADKVLFPGQGEASGAMVYLSSHGLVDVIRSLSQPEGDTDCIGIFDADVKRFTPQRHEDKVPAMGWNSLHDLRGPLFEGLSDQPYVYFVHSYYVPLCTCTAATADYILPYSAALMKDNFYTCQFHPEKSGDVGERILENFLRL